MMADFVEFWRDLVTDRAPVARGLVLGFWWNMGLLLLSLVALPFDHRLILGLNPG